MLVPLRQENESDMRQCTCGTSNIFKMSSADFFAGPGARTGIAACCCCCCCWRALPEGVASTERAEGAKGSSGDCGVAVRARPPAPAADEAEGARLAANGS